MPVEYAQETQDGCQALWGLVHLCLPSDYLLEGESTKAATAPITDSKT